MEIMSMGTFLWTSLGAFLTLATFSFLYKDNPFYKLAEHLVVGVSAGYFVIILWHNGLQPNLFNRLGEGNFWYFIPMILGIMMWTRFSRKWSWVSRWPIAIYLGIATGLSIPLEMRNRVNMQLYSTMREVNWENFFGNGFLDPTSGYSGLIIFLGVLATLFYFFFSKEHTGVFKGVAQLGIWILMVGFGTSFGYTVMARISLFIQRIQVLGDYTKISWSGVSGTFLTLWFITFGIFVALALYELVKYIGNRKTAT